MKILFVTSEAAPLIKTGGLADVSGALPAALAARGHDVRILLPAYGDALENASRAGAVAEVAVHGTPGKTRLLATTMPDSGVWVYLADYGPAFARHGHPYLAPDGDPWPDNPERFALFSRVAAAVSLDRAGLDWQPQVVHCNDWQSALVPALLQGYPGRPECLFTIHNLAYQGVFPHQTFIDLGLPPDLWRAAALEYYGRLSFIKGGLVYADWLTTVSPTYAREIQTPEFGFGLDGLLKYRSTRLKGILNGADYGVWDPANDSNIASPYDAADLSGKAANKAALQQAFNLPQTPDTPLIGMVGRLVEQKGIDLVLAALPELLHLPLQLVLLGSGDRQFEQALRELAARYPTQVSVRIGYDEALAHRIEAGADMFLMPSRFEPCGLNQIYSLRYATLPIVHRTGGLADTVVDADGANLRARTATGFVFDTPSPAALGAAVERALALYARPTTWKNVMHTAMAADFSWGRSAEEYEKLYGGTAAV